MRESIKKILSEFPEVLFATVFGSAVSDRLTSFSDVDIGVAGQRKLSYETRTDLTLSLSRVLHREVDLIDLHAVSGLILKEALCSGNIIKNNPATYAFLLKKMWYNQADMMPHYKKILYHNCRNFFNG